MSAYGSLKRKEDARFIRGRGRFVDDVQLPGMLHGAVLRSPVAHARIVSIDTSAGLQHPRVHPGITDGLWSVSENVRTPRLSNERVSAFISASVFPSGDSITLLTTPSRDRIPTARTRRMAGRSANVCNGCPSGAATPT